MRSYVTHYRATFTMTSGKVLACEYATAHYDGSFDEPPSDEVSDPAYFIGGILTDYADLPKGLATVADDLYENYPPKYGRTDVYDPRDDY